jgi:hypothetical protein
MGITNESILIGFCKLNGLRLQRMKTKHLVNYYYIDDAERRYVIHLTEFCIIECREHVEWFNKKMQEYIDEFVIKIIKDEYVGLPGAKKIVREL